MIIDLWLLLSELCNIKNIQWLPRDKIEQTGMKSENIWLKTGGSEYKILFNYTCANFSKCPVKLNFGLY